MTAASVGSDSLFRSARGSVASTQAASVQDDGAETTQYPYDTVVYITDVIGGLEYQASGVLISPDEVLTASHVVYSRGVGLASQIEVSPGYEAGSTPFGTATGVSFHYNQVEDIGDSISGSASQSDYAVIHLSESFTTLGVMHVTSGFDGGAVTITGYPAVGNGGQISSQQVVTQDPQFTLLDGVALGDGSSGGPVWVTGQNGAADVVGLVSSGSTDTDAGYNVQITPAAASQIAGWVATDDVNPAPAATAATPSLAVFDTTTEQAVTPQFTAYSGPVQGVAEEWISVSSDNLNVTAGSPNWFIHTGSGEDAVTVQSGTNVIDGGTGSNFLTGGTGTDTFFTDDSGATAAIWDTLVNFHTGDAATIFGVTQSADTLAWANGQGAGGYTGLTLHATAAGAAEASVTLTGYSSAALSDGALTTSFGTTGGLPYMYILAH